MNGHYLERRGENNHINGHKRFIVIRINLKGEKNEKKDPKSFYFSRNVFDHCR